MTWPYPRHRTFESKLRVAAANWFAKRGLKVHSRYSFLLADWNDWPSNIIDPEVVRYINEERQRREIRQEGFPLHKFIHHGLSSQAMTLNLFGPLIVRNDLGVLKDAFVAEELPWPEGDVTGDFEFEDRNMFNEDAGQPTSIDVVLRDGTGQPKLFIESKFMEKELGGCSVFKNGDCDGSNPAKRFSSCFLNHIGRQYWPLMNKWGFLDGPLATDSTCIFASHYQFFREVLFALESGGTFVLLSDERSPTFNCHRPQGERGLMALLLSLVPAKLHQHIGQISLQRVVEKIKVSGRHPWITEFEQKYGLA